MKISVSSRGKGKVYTHGFKVIDIDLESLGKVANRNAISGAGFKDGHRKGENIIRGSNIILIDCDEQGQAEAIETKLQYYDYVKVPSASNLKYPYKWHYIVPTREPLSVYPAAFKWQVAQFFRQIGITDEMIDTSGSYDAVRQFAPASIGMRAEKADELCEVNATDLHAPIAEAPEELCNAAAKSVSLKIKGMSTIELPSGRLWHQGTAITYDDATNAVREALRAKEKEDENIIISGFGCPHNNDKHTGDITVGYGFAFVGNDDEVIVKCTGNACKDHPYFTVPEALNEEEILKYETAKTHPIDPKDFSLAVKNRILDLQPEFVFSKNMLDGFYFYGATYNECVYRNSNGLEPQRLSLPAPTGSGKSVSAELYLSIIAILALSGLLVVGKVKDAIEAVKKINTLAGKQVAACIYTVSKKNPDDKARVSIDELQKYPIAVITHNMFLSRSSTFEDIDLIKNYNKSPRYAVIIDEQIDFKRTISFSSDELLDASRLVNELKGWDEIDAIFEVIGSYKMENQVMTSKHKSIVTMMRKGIGLLRSGQGYVGLRKDRKDEAREAVDRDWIIRLMDRVAYVFSGQNIVINQGRYNVFSINEDLTNQFGSAVILDATSNAAPIYKSHAVNRNDIELFKMPEGIRSYKNATLHICHDKNRKQSKGQLVEVAKAKGTINDIVDSYLKVLYPLVADGNKLLVVVFIGIEETFRTRCKDDNITFIHWGEHEGRNDFNKYSKAAAIGWYRKSGRKYYEDIDAILSDTGKYTPLGSSMANDVANMIIGGLAADFIQFFNRTRSRVAIDEDGNCKLVDFYMFDDGSKDDPTTIIEREMPGIKIATWEPTTSYPIVKSTATDARAERIIKWLQSQPGSNVSHKSIAKNFGFSERQVKRVIDSNIFKLLAEDLNITIDKREGRYGGTFLSIPIEFEPALLSDDLIMKKIRTVT